MTPITWAKEQIGRWRRWWFGRWYHVANAGAGRIPAQQGFSDKILSFGNISQMHGYQDIAKLRSFYKRPFGIDLDIIVSEALSTKFEL